MNMKNLILGLVVAAMVVATSTDANAQGRLRSLLQQRSGGLYNGFGADGMTTAEYSGPLSYQTTLRYAATDPFSPNPIYAYSMPGLAAQHTHQWNQQEAASRSWHDNYSHWRYGVPTALVVPPTASYETSYAWGVGQVQSNPIHSQFGAGGAGMIGGGAGAQQAPYWPSSTRQQGIYPVRAAW